MKCLETEKLIRYAYHLTDEPAAAEVRAHLEECPRCRGLVEQYGRLNALLDEWKVAEPTPGFDARVRQAVEAQQAKREAWGFGGLGWVRGLAVASLGILIIAGAVWFTERHHRGSNLSAVASQQPRRPLGAQTPATQLSSSAVPAPAGVRRARAASATGSAGAISNADQDALALEDYDLAANFDLLSELPKGESRVVN
jgi:anti-sigma factor RsiW